MPKISRIIAKPITHTINLEPRSNHICIDSVKQDFDERASKIGFILFASTLKIVKTTNDLTRLVAISPISPERGSINVHIYRAIVIGTNPIGHLLVCIRRDSLNLLYDKNFENGKDFDLWKRFFVKGFLKKKVLKNRLLNKP